MKWHGPGTALVREELDYVTVPVDNPRYKGRTFNRVLDHGARGRYAACASDKLRWNGIRELVVPSYHTSTTDHRHGVVDARQRRGERFGAARDGLEAHADEHAAHTVAAWLTLVPLQGRTGDRLAA